MHTNTYEGDIEVVLFERGELPPPAERQATAVYERLESLVEAGHIDSVSRETWVKRTPLDDCDGDLRDTYLSFESWAEETGVSLQPFFQTRECFTPSEGEHTDWLVMPAFCVAVYAETDLSAVYPHADGNDTQTVEDGLQALLDEASGDTTPEPLAAD